MYYPGEEKLVSLDILKLYRGEDVVRQTPADIDPDLWKDKGELTELPETPVGAVMLREPCLDPVNPKVMNTPDPDVPMILDSPEEIEMREGIHERIQAEIHQEVREEAFQAEERLNAPPAWNEVDLGGKY